MLFTVAAVRLARAVVDKEGSGFTLLDSSVGEDLGRRGHSNGNYNDNDTVVLFFLAQLVEYVSAEEPESGS